jgi:hypothetical protein
MTQLTTLVGYLAGGGVDNLGKRGSAFSAYAFIIFISVSSSSLLRKGLSTPEDFGESAESGSDVITSSLNNTTAGSK